MTSLIKPQCSDGFTLTSDAVSKPYECEMNIFISPQCEMGRVHLQEPRFPILFMMHINAAVCGCGVALSS